ncbi:MAG: hypothetical protein ACI8Z1_003457 [Candidatus Azotimanducaceae bacterium]|jgi:hypothetical protein
MIAALLRRALGDNNSPKGDDQGFTNSLIGRI